MQELLAQLLPIPSFICDTEGLPNDLRSMLHLRSSWFHFGGLGQQCVPSEGERPTDVMHVALGANGGRGGRAQTPGQASFLVCKPVPAPGSLPALLSHTTERLRQGFPLPLPEGIHLINFIIYSYQVSPLPLWSPSIP